MSTSPPPPPPPAPAAPPGADFFDRIRALGVARPDEGRWFAGVAAGLARRWGVDPLVVRGLFVAAAIFTGVGLLAYGLAWLFLPHPDGRIHAQEVLRGTVTAGFVGGVAAVLLNGTPRGAWGWGWGDDGVGPFFAGPVVLLLILGGIWWYFSQGPGRTAGPGGPVPGGPVPGGPVPGGPAGPVDGPADPAAGPTPPVYGTPTPNPPPGPGRGGEPEDPPATTAFAHPAPAAVSSRIPAAATLTVPSPPDPEAPSRAVTRTTLGLAILAAAAVLAWDRFVTPLRDADGGLATVVALGVVALGIVVSGLIGRRPGGLAPVAVVLAVLCLAGVGLRSTVVGGVGERTWRPADVAAAEQGFSLGVGEARLDLTDARVTAGATAADPVDVSARVGVGRLLVVVPRGTAVEVDGSAGVGRVENRTGGTGSESGARETLVRTGSGGALVVVEAQIGIGSVEIVEEEVR